MIGTTLGKFRIVEQVGMGGMATVYKAYDPDTDRYVAVKVLSHHYSQEPTFLERFRREAKAVAGLQHPYILPVHAYGEQDGTAYLVMPYMATGTLRGVLAGGALPLNEASHLLGQIAGALDYAHRKGIIHRDVKPSNVLVDGEGNAYLTDFGIAKIVEATLELTGTGMALGTPQYMSPEQCQGVKDLTPATDIYSLGIVLYQMLTGEVPFQAETPMAVIQKHLTAPLPPPRTLRPDLPDAVEGVVLKALAKEPRQRFNSAAEMGEALASAVRIGEAQAVTDLPPAPPPDDLSSATIPLPPERRRGPLWPWLAAGAVGLGVLLVVGGLALAGLLGGGLLRPAAQEPPTVPAEVSMMEPADGPTVLPTEAPTQAPAPVPAPTLAPSITPVPTPLGGGSGRLAFCRDGSTYTMAVDGSDVVTLATECGALSPDGSRIAYVDTFKLYVMNVDGSGITDLGWGIGPQWSPDGTRITLYSTSDIYTVNADGTNRTKIIEDTASYPGGGLSPDGSKITFVGGHDIYVANADGSNHVNLTNTVAEVESSPAWSPDGIQIAFECCGYSHRSTDIYVMNVDGSGVVQLTDEPGSDGSPAWSPDGERIAFSSDRSGNYDIYIMNADGSNVTRLTDHPLDETSPAWQP